MIYWRDSMEEKNLFAPAQNSFFCPMMCERIFERGQDGKEDAMILKKKLWNKHDTM